MNKIPDKTIAGVTLIECLVCLGLALVGLTLGLEALRVCRTIGTRSNTMAALSLAAQESLAEASTQPFDSLSSGTVRTERMLGGDARTGAAGIAATIERRVTPVGSDLKEVTVEAEWQGGKDPLRVTLATRVARPSEGNR